MRYLCTLKLSLAGQNEVLVHTKVVSLAGQNKVLVHTKVVSGQAEQVTKVVSLAG